ncbi:hypothetical protein ABR36_11475 [Enterobacter ludwigii]|nr:hypothetical protein ABR36_11475 [Enterobacter ludwigii]
MPDWPAAQTIVPSSARRDHAPGDELAGSALVGVKMTGEAPPGTPVTNPEGESPSQEIPEVKLRVSARDGDEQNELISMTVVVR